MADAIPVTAEVVAHVPQSRALGLAELFLTGYKSHTLDAYRTDLRMWFAFCGSLGIDPLDAQRAHVELFVRHEEDRGLMASTVARRIGTISTYYQYGVDEEMITRNPARRARRPKVPEESTTNGLDRHALACVLGLNALRVSEACSLDIESMSVERGHTVISFVGKNSKPATVPLAPRTKLALLTVIGERTSGPIFLRADGNRMDRHAARRIVKRICRRAGITKRISPHSLRHAGITAAFDANVPPRDVQDFARHADPRTTSRYDRNRQSLDRNPTYVISAFVAP